MKIYTMQDLEKVFDKEQPENKQWTSICIFYQLSENFMREFADKLNWDCIPAHQILSEDFIREFRSKLNFGLVCKYQKLSESFIEEMMKLDRTTFTIDWYNLSEYQQLSRKFIFKHIDKVKIMYLLQNDEVSDDVKEELKMLIKLMS